MRFIILGLSLLLTGCVASSSGYYTQSIQNWRGGSTKDLVRVWGTPDEKFKEPSGKTIYVYRKESFTAEEKFHSPSVGVNTQQNGRPVITTTNDINEIWNKDLAITCTVMFIASPRGVILKSKTIGKDCFIKKSLAKSLANPK